MSGANMNPDVEDELRTQTFGTVVHGATRTAMLADGRLIDITPAAARAGYVVPVAITHTAWAWLVMWDERSAQRGAFVTAEMDRLRAVLDAAREQTRRLQSSLRVMRIRCAVQRVQLSAPSSEPTWAAFDLATGCDEQGRPTFTIMTTEDE